MKNAILVESAECRGSGSDRYKWINGLTKKVIETCRNIDPDAEILVPSHTEYMGQKYKLARNSGGEWGWTHRQINDNDYRILATVDGAGYRTVTTHTI